MGEPDFELLLCREGRAASGRLTGLLVMVVMSPSSMNPAWLSTWGPLMYV